MLYPWLEPYFKQIASAVEQGRLSNSLIIAGRQGMGVGSLALEIAKLYLCENPQPHGACGHCHSCTMFEKSHAHPDLKIARATAKAEDVKNDGDFLCDQQALLEFSAEESKHTLRIDTLRKVSGFLAESALNAHGKVVIIRDAETMTEGAANAILKTFEEPHAQSLVIMVTQNLEMLLPTIRSRAVKLIIDGLRLDDVLDYMLNPAHQVQTTPHETVVSTSKVRLFNKNELPHINEGQKITKERIALAMALTADAPLDAMDLLLSCDDQRIVTILENIRAQIEKAAEPFAASLEFFIKDISAPLLYRTLYTMLIETLKLKAGYAIKELPLLNAVNGTAFASLNSRRIFDAFPRLRAFTGGRQQIPPPAFYTQYRSWVALLLMDNTFGLKL